MKNNNSPATNTLEAHTKRYSSARADLLIMIVLTVVNIVMMFTGSESMMLFSATIPYFAVGAGYWEGDQEVMIFGIGIAVVCIALYLLCWFMSKKKYQWLIIASVLFALDTAAMIYLYASSGEIASGTFDIVIHAFVLYYLIVGIITGKKLKELKANENTLGEGLAEENLTEYENQVDLVNETTYKRRADMDVKFRILAEAEYNGHYIAYRRVKRVNELVVDGYVYDEIEMLVETPHELTAVINGDIIQAGLAASSKSYINVNGNQIAKKIRLM